MGLGDVGLLGPYESSFRVIDAYDYSSIGKGLVNSFVAELKLCNRIKRFCFSHE